MKINYEKSQYAQELKTFISFNQTFNWNNHKPEVN